MVSKDTRGRKPIPVVDSVPYSSIIFLVASGVNYSEAIAKARNTDSSASFKQLENLRELKFLNEPKKEKLLNKTIYSVNWKKIIEEFIAYLEENVDTMLSENQRMSTNVDKIVKGFYEYVKWIKDKNYQNDLRHNSLLYKFFEGYYSTLGRSKSNWTILQTFEFLLFFGDMNFIEWYSSSHDFFIVEKIITAQTQKMTFPDWLKEEKKPLTEEQEFERFKKIREHTHKEADHNEKAKDEAMRKFINEHKEVRDLHTLTGILNVGKIKPSLQLGLNNAIREAGKLMFLKSFTKDEIKDYYVKIGRFLDVQRNEHIQQDLKDMFGSEFLQELKHELKHELKGESFEEFLKKDTKERK